jgi:hypothetical protein
MVQDDDTIWETGAFRPTSIAPTEWPKPNRSYVDVDLLVEPARERL